MTVKPSYTTMATHFGTIYGDGTLTSVGTRIGGKVEQNISNGIFTNGCAIRMSYALNFSGVLIPRSESWSTPSGADGKWYIFRVRYLLKFLRHAFGVADSSAANPTTSSFSNQKGILVFDVEGWSDASGHATLWNGTSCSDHCYFNQAKEASIWTLS